jgi:hypothetical protein
MDDDKVDLALELLDRQLIDSEGTPCGKVDDLELTMLEDGQAPVVTHILTNPGALAPRLRGRMGKIVHAVWKRLHEDCPPKPTAIDWRLVGKADFAVHLTVQREEAGLMRTELWALKTIVEKIPGA